MIQHCEQRILTRIQPPWKQQPAYFKKPRPFLGDQLSKWVDLLRQEDHRSGLDLDPLFKRAGELCESLEPLRHGAGDAGKRQTIIKNIIHECVAMAFLGNTRSLEDHLKHLKLPAAVHGAQEIRQVDKLARYLLLCKDLIQISRKPEYVSLFGHVDVVALESFDGVFRHGVSRKCFVHAEMLQVMHYEQKSHRPQPRAIGCSKSACYLCDLFILKQGRYRVSDSHRRLYEKWTIPDVNWMTESQALTFRTVVQEMIRELKDKASGNRGSAYSPRFPLESRAYLPLLGDSTTSGATVMKSSSNISGNGLSAAVSRIPSVVQVTKNDLPVSRHIQPGQGNLDIRIDELTLCFEFVCISGLQLSVSRAQTSSEAVFKTINVFDIPTNRDITMACPHEPSRLSFRMQLHSCFAVDVDIAWV